MADWGDTGAEFSYNTNVLFAVCRVSSFHSKAEAENAVTLADLSKVFSEATELKQLQKPVLMVMTEPIKIDVEILGGEKGSR